MVVFYFSKTVNVYKPSKSPMIKGEMKFSSNYPIEKFVLEGSVFSKAKGNDSITELIINDVTYVAYVVEIYVNITDFWRFRCN